MESAYWNPTGLFVQKLSLAYAALLIVSTDIAGLRSKSRTHSFSSLLTHVERRHASLWCSRIHGRHAGGHEVCDLLQSQQASGRLPFLQLILDHCLQLIAECLPVRHNADTKTDKNVRAKKQTHMGTMTQKQSRKEHKQVKAHKHLRLRGQGNFRTNLHI